ncbi:MAG: InlB B-repeat-containing protein, partial [Ruminococcus sp.]
DLTVTAVYSSTVNKYTVTFVDEDGTVLDEQQVEYGSSATAPKTPVKEADAQYTYTFEKWDKDFSNITKDLTVTAVYSSTVNKYTVTFVDEDGTVLDEQQVEYGSSATAPEAPAKSADENGTYEFSGWDTEFSNVVSDMTVTALYKFIPYATIPETTDATIPETIPETTEVITTEPVTTVETTAPSATQEIKSEPENVATADEIPITPIATGVGSVMIIILCIAGAFWMFTSYCSKLKTSEKNSHNKKEGR